VATDHPTPRAWLETALPAWFADLGPALPEHRFVTRDEAVALLPELHALLTAGTTPRKAAAKYLAAWFGGLVTGTVGYGLLATGAAFVADPERLRWRVHPGGWADVLELGEAVALVPEGHAWSGLPGTETVDDARERAVLAVVEAVRPLVEALRPLSGLGFPGLWAEVGDGFGSPLAYQSTVAATPERIAVLDALADTPGTPWRRRSRLWIASDGICVQQKGGCCLAYTEPETDKCSNCALREPASCEADQVAWHLEQLTP
jgi:ferric iron reductase protein FhuF